VATATVVRVRPIFRNFECAGARGGSTIKRDRDRERERGKGRQRELELEIEIERHGNKTHTGMCRVTELTLHLCKCTKMLCKLTCFMFGREVGLERLMWQVPTRTTLNLSMWHIGVYWLEFHAKQSGTYTLILDTYIVDLVTKVWSQCHWYRPDTCLFKEKHCGVHSSFARLSPHVTSQHQLTMVGTKPKLSRWNLM